ncbi:hypothetical protein NQ042_04585 [Corynebacterium phoceense]|uniref:hypothetical protein n=1 Tax=Corynebacterium phoceense TaxID=1686286 RepID=UPI00211C430C|nr:hypothetical protein [Corynebacterium phoceense]MCQ9333377.1 hypothetical protein [Corynebacterium phoceense]
MAQSRKRRRATRLSDAPNYDRTADRPPFQSAFGPDGERAVPVDDEAAAAGEELTGEEFYRAQQPPHYGA